MDAELEFSALTTEQDPRFEAFYSSYAASIPVREQKPRAQPEVFPYNPKSIGTAWIRAVPVAPDEILAEVIPWLEARDIYSRGRFGMWKYEVSNTDHTLMQGVELVNRLVLGEAETTIGMVYRITTDGREAAVHERSAHAGSGEKKLPVQSAPAAPTPASSNAKAASSAAAPPSRRWRWTAL